MLINEAALRIENDEELVTYFDLFINYDWENLDEHLAWITNADKLELLDWAESVSKYDSQ